VAARGRGARRLLFRLDAASQTQVGLKAHRDLLVRQPLQERTKPWIEAAEFGDGVAHALLPVANSLAERTTPAPHA
jgi:hypothetical protein